MDIETITVKADYCFGNLPVQLQEIGKVNFVFAPNGSGKTTISNALASQPSDPPSREKWPVAPTSLAIRVFNEDYRSRVLTENVDGIFTMGDKSKDVNEEIANLEAGKKHRSLERDRCRNEIGSIGDKENTRGLLGEIENLRITVRDSVFDAHRDAPKPAIELVFKGFRNDREKFFTEALRRFKDGEDIPEDVNWESLETRAIILKSTNQPRTMLPTIVVSSLISAEEIEDVKNAADSSGTGEFAQLIQHLENEDWVSEGRDFMDTAEEKCPFCQQQAPRDLEGKLADYFAGGFDDALERATEIKRAVLAKADQLERELSKLESALSQDPKINEQRFKDAISSTRNSAGLLVSQAEEKAKHPTRPVDVTDVGRHIRKLSTLLDSENFVIEQHNEVIANATRENKQVIDSGWTLFLTQPAVSGAIKRFQGIRTWKETDISRLRAEIAEYDQADKNDEQAIVELRNSVSNTVEVANRINNLIQAMGFHRFSIETSDSVAGGYRLVRENGTSAFDTLSEGEKSFICFAYFWESLFGSVEPGNSPEEVVAVIDDPISSLDSDTLFIVAAHVRHAAKLTVSGESNLRQLIVLTHNTQFHHEAAYSSNEHKMAERHYYRLTKDLDGTTSVKDDKNRSKIRGTYPLLWDSVVEAARVQDESALVQVGVYNIVRRIIEGYFRTIGNVKDHQRPQELSPVDERVIYMFHMWASSGSHTIAEDIDQTIDVGGVRRFLRLFRKYFTIEGHSAHFDMMVRASGGADLIEPDEVFAPLD